MKLQTHKRIVICLLVNIIIIGLLYYIPINNGLQLCIYKNITGKECFNCGMTRAFLSIIHFNFKEAINYNKNVLVVFPFTVFLYIKFWINYIKKEGVNKNE